MKNIVFLNAGLFSNRNDYEATFAKRCYYYNIIDYYVSLFIAHNNIHAFYDGKKITALHWFNYLLNSNTEYSLLSIDNIAFSQLKYLEKQITEEEFEKIIKNNISKVRYIGFLIFYLIFFNFL